MKINEIEKIVIKNCIESQGVIIDNTMQSFIDCIELSNREYTNSGFFSEFHKLENLRVFKHGGSKKWGDFSCTLNSSIEAGFLVFIEDGYITCIEGYTYGERWPSNIDNID